MRRLQEQLEARITNSTYPLDSQLGEKLSELLVPRLMESLLDNFDADFYFWFPLYREFQE